LIKSWNYCNWQWVKKNKTVYKVATSLFPTAAADG